MVEYIGRRLRRPLQADVFRACVEAYWQLADLAGDEVRVGHVAHPDTAIESFGHQIDVGIGKTHVHVQRRVRTGQCRCELGRHGRRSRDAQQPAQVAVRCRFFACRVDGRADVGRAIPERKACLGEHRAPCRARQQFRAQLAKLDANEIAANRRDTSNEAHAAAAIEFAAALIRKRGAVEASAVAAVRDAGDDDAQILEIVAHVALNTFTNYVNEAFDTEIDFPRVQRNTDALAT